MLSTFCGCCYAGFNIVSKVSQDKGMSRYVLVVYAHAFGTFGYCCSCYSLLREKKNKSKITKCVLCDIFFLGLLGAVLGRMIFKLTHGQCCFHPLPFLAAVLRYQHASNRGKKEILFW
ncbi:hypothetical protein AB3S75_032583 [Citrus x aurantiifolia]